AALEATHCACERSGWSTHFVTLWQRAADGAGEQLVAALPMYAKTHSYGEYVFDWAWADAYQRHDLPYYPKLL
ncbi:peptidogalycan biosysnthesis protein, partial [Escherichia coli]